MAWTNLSFPFGSTLTSAQMTQVDDNFDAVAAGSTGAPKIQAAALEQTGGSEAVTQDTIRNAAVGQSQIKTTTGAVSTSGTSPTLLTLPGGTYGFYPQIKSTTSTAYRYSVAPITHVRADSSYLTTSLALSISYVTRIAIAAQLGTVSAQQRYFQASPPYDLGDGEIPLFIFAEVNINGEVVAAYVAPEAPWHYNGPTDIRANHYRDGIGYQRRKDDAEIDAAMVAAGHASGLTMAAARATGDSVLADYIAAFNAAPEHEREVTQLIKNADMNLIPRPMDPRDGNSVILLDPVAAIGANMLELMKHDEFDLNKMLHEGDIIIDNTPLVRATPSGVQAFNWRLR